MIYLRSFLERNFLVFCTNLLKQVVLLSPMVDQACGCEADSGDPDYSCDCAMQGHCICSNDCTCSTDVCKEAVGQMSK